MPYSGMLIESRSDSDLSLNQIDALDREKFKSLLKEKLKISIEEFSFLQGMCEHRVQLFLNNINRFETLLNLGISADELASVKETQLKFFLYNSSKLKEELPKLGITLQQAATIHLKLLKEYFQFPQSFEPIFNIGFSIIDVNIMEKNRYQLICNNISKIKTLMRMGVTKTQLQQIDLERLKKYFAASYRMSIILKFISIQQLLGIDNKPLPVSHFSESNEEKRSHYISGESSFGEFTEKFDANHIIFTHENPITHQTSSYHLLFGKVVKNAINKYNDYVLDNPPIELIHTWYRISEGIDQENKLTSIIYCSALKYLVQEKMTESFPQNKCKQSHSCQLTLRSVEFYKEWQFVNFINRHHYNIQQFKKDYSKNLLLLVNHLSAVEYLMDKGFKLEDFSKVEEKRLNYILKHYATAEYALDFVTINELLGVKTIHSNEAGFFKKQTSKKLENGTSQKKNCLVM